MHLARSEYPQHHHFPFLSTESTELRSDPNSDAVYLIESFCFVWHTVSTIHTALARKFDFRENFERWTTAPCTQCHSNKFDLTAPEWTLHFCPHLLVIMCTNTIFIYCLHTHRIQLLVFLLLLVPLPLPLLLLLLLFSLSVLSFHGA